MVDWIFYKSCATFLKIRPVIFCIFPFVKISHEKIKNNNELINSICIAKD